MSNDERPASPPYDLCERTFQFALRIITVCLVLEKQRTGVGWTSSKQLMRSVTSVGDNVEEGQAAQSRADFISKYSIARKEARETKYWLRLMLASQVFGHSDLSPLIGESDELIRILTAIIKKMQVDA